MTQDFAQHLFHEGAAVVLLNVPVLTQIGIDMHSWSVGPKFKGIKMIPPGLHYIYYSAVSKQGESAPPTGFFHHFQPKEVIVKVYQPDKEEFISESEEQTERVRVNLRSLDGELGPYPVDTWRRWISLSQHINKEHLESVLPLSENSSEPCSSKFNEVAPKTDGLPELKSVPGMDFRWYTFPKLAYKEGASPSEITAASIDSSYLLQCLVDQLKSPSHLVSELQLSFVVFLVAQCWSGWERWRSLLDVFCRAEAGLLHHPQVYSDLIGALHYQIQEVPEDLFVDIVEQNNFLAASLCTLFANVNDNADKLPRALVERAQKFRAHLVSRFGWNLDPEENDEDVPVIVELP
ncbi:A1 cistron-splicing factor AAR2 [Trinorchestia longiramus]|nr:A1 cistron-splicing factor AAR2 [Trinorchestia longiramus]